MIDTTRWFGVLMTKVFPDDLGGNLKSLLVWIYNHLHYKYKKEKKMKQEYENEPLINNLGPGFLTRTDFCERYFFIRLFSH